MRSKDVHVCSVHLIGAVGERYNKCQANIDAHMFILISWNISIIYSDKFQKLFMLLLDSQRMPVKSSCSMYYNIYSCKMILIQLRHAEIALYLSSIHKCKFEPHSCINLKKSWT
jgi:hypothetical protein